MSHKRSWYMDCIVTLQGNDKFQFCSGIMYNNKVELYRHDVKFWVLPIPRIHKASIDVILLLKWVLLLAVHVACEVGKL